MQVLKWLYLLVVLYFTVRGLVELIFMPKWVSFEEAKRNVVTGMLMEIAGIVGIIAYRSVTTGGRAENGILLFLVIVPTLILFLFCSTIQFIERKRIKLLTRVYNVLSKWFEGLGETSGMTIISLPAFFYLGFFLWCFRLLV